MTATTSRRVVALVGRPSVGKSALFNRLLQRRLAIVHETWGVTRDRLVDEVHWDDQRFMLIDTGGIGVMDNAALGDDLLAQGAREQVEAAMEEASVIVQVVDVRAGLHPLDIEVARLLRSRGRPVLLAANKADHPDHDMGAVDFTELGFPVYPISALQGRGLDALMGAVLERLPPPEEEPSHAAPLRIAVVGRPNVGKSSFINRLLGVNRVIVSDIPGTTRDSVAVPFRIGSGPEARAYVWVDTAGVRPKAKVKEPIEFFSLARVEQAIREADVVAHVLDATEGPGRQDRWMAGLIQRYGRGAVLVVNKWDLAKGVSMEDYEAALRRAMPFICHVPVVFISARTGRGIRAAIAAVDRVGAQVSAQCSTGLLNRVIHRAMKRVQPPAVQGKRLKVYYAVQVGARPLRFRLFVNDPERRTPAYEAYLVNALRNAFGLEGAPVFLEYERSGRSDRNTAVAARATRRTEK